MKSEPGAQGQFSDRVSLKKDTFGIPENLFLINTILISIPNYSNSIHKTFNIGYLVVKSVRKGYNILRNLFQHIGLI